MKDRNRGQRRQSNWYKAQQKAIEAIRRSSRIEPIIKAQNKLKPELVGYTKKENIEIHDLQMFQQVPDALKGQWFGEVFKELKRQVDALNDESTKFIKEHNLRTVSEDDLNEFVTNIPNIERLETALNTGMKLDALDYSNIVMSYKLMTKLLNMTSLNKENREGYVNYLNKVQERIDLSYDIFQAKHPNNRMSKKEYNDAYWRVFNTLVDKNLLPSDQAFDLLDTGDYDVFDEKVSGKIIDSMNETLAYYDKEANEIREKARLMKKLAESEAVEQKQLREGQIQLALQNESYIKYWQEELEGKEEDKPYQGEDMTGRSWLDKHPGYETWANLQSINWEDPTAESLIKVLWLKDYNQNNSAIKGKFTKAMHKLTAELDPEELKQYINIVKDHQLSLPDIDQHINSIRTLGPEKALLGFELEYKRKTAEETYKETNKRVSISFEDMAKEIEKPSIVSNASTFIEEDDGSLGDIL